MHIRFIVNEFLVGVWRNLAMTLSIVLVTFVSLTFVGAAMLCQAQIDKMKDDWYDKVQVSIFLCTKDSQGPTCPSGRTTDDQRQLIEDDLNSAELAPYIDSVQFETQEQAFQRFQERFADTPSISDGVTADQMPDSYRVKLKDPEQYRVVSERFKGVQGVDDVVDQQEVLEKLFTVLNRLTYLAAGIALVMVAAAMLLINTTIRLSAFNRRREVGIMRLVGASNAVIQLPFLLEGVFAACVGATLAAGGLTLFLKASGSDWLTGGLQMRYVGASEMLSITPALFAIAVGFAAVSAIVALNRYLKV